MNRNVARLSRSFTCRVTRRQLCSVQRAAPAILAAAERGCPVYEYAPTRIKQSTVGRGGAGKDQVAFMVRALLGLTETPGADAADALAIGLTHLRIARERRGLACPAVFRYDATIDVALAGAHRVWRGVRLAGRLSLRKRGDDSLGDELLLLEHEPVYTIGRTPDQSQFAGPSHLPHPLFPINRGGQATYHGQDNWSAIQLSICAVAARICIAICGGSEV